MCIEARWLENKKKRLLSLIEIKFIDYSSIFHLRDNKIYTAKKSTIMQKYDMAA